MKKVYVIVVLLAVLGVGSYLFYDFKYGRKVIDGWGLIPQNALMVYESQHLVRSWNAISTSPLYKNLQAIPFFNKANSYLNMADSLTGKDGSLDKLLTGNSFLFSMHLISKNQFDGIFYIDLRGDKSSIELLEAFEQLKKQKHIQVGSRVYQNQTLWEVRNKKDNSLFTYLIHKNYFAGSFTPFLAEDVVRCINESSKGNFKTLLSSATSQVGTQDDLGRFYLNLAKLTEFLNAFVQEKSEWPGMIKHFSSLSTLELRLTQNELLFNGFTQNQVADSTSFMSTFKGQSPSEMRMKHLVPERTAWLYHFTFSDPILWEEALGRFVSGNKQIVDSRKKVLTDFQTRPKEFYEFMDGENALATLESVNPAKPDKLLFIRCNDINEALNRLNKFSEKVSLQQKDTLLSEFYGDNLITFLNLPEFPSFLFGDGFKGFDYSYYTLMGKYLVIGNNIEVMKSLINDIETENTWGKSVKQNLYLENSVSEANVSLMVNTSRIWSLFRAQIEPEMMATLDKYSTAIKGMEHWSFQLSNADQQLYTSVAISYNLNAQKPVANARYVVLNQSKLKSPARIKPYIVKNHIDNSLEIFIQDSSNFIYLIDAKGQILWEDSLGAPIISEVHQIDYFKNGKLQLAFASSNAFYIIDRNGDPVDQYPLGVNYKIDKLSILDYDNSKNYRWLLTDAEGNAYMYDKSRNNLEGWNPNKFSGKMAFPPMHIRARGKDFILAIQTDGKVNLTNRRGEMEKSFPFDLKDKVYNTAFVEVGSSWDNSSLTTITDRGSLVQLSLSGKVIRNEQLYKPAKETTFTLVPDALKRTYLIARQDLNRVSLLDRQANLIFDKDYITSGQMLVQYFGFGSGNNIYAITDPVQEFTYIYDHEGNLVNFEPLESGFSVGMLFKESTNTYLVYSCFGSGIYLQEFKVGRN